LFPAWSNAADEEGHAAVDEWLRREEERTIKECNDCAEMRASRDRSGDVTEERRREEKEERGRERIAARRELRGRVKDNSQEKIE
jgi:hypothetical protein